MENTFLIAKRCLLTGQEQACSRVTQLFVWLVVRHHAENGLIEDEFVDDGDCIVGGGGSDQRSGDVSEQQ